MAPITNPALAAAADFDLYRECRALTGLPAAWRTRAGQVIEPMAARAAVAAGLLGDFADAELLPGGVWAERMDLSDAGLDYVLRRQAA